MTGMRILLASDGSTPAEVAHQLTASIPWPAGSTIRIVTAVTPPIGLYTTPLSAAPALPTDIDRLEAEVAAAGEQVLEEAARAVAASGCSVERRLLRGRAGSAIVDEAAEWQPDVVIIGSRGHGAISSMLLGSVSAEVVDHAPCPVLVGRRPTMTRVVLGHDGSEYAMAAEHIMRSWPIFSRVAIEVVSVAHVKAPWRVGIAPTLYAEAMEAHRQATEISAAEHARIAEESARRLAESGLRASAAAVEGDPAAMLIGTADEHQADLTVLGTHGRTGVSRALLGSVARNVMQHASSSVMVVRAAEATQP